MFGFRDESATEGSHAVPGSMHRDAAHSHQRRSAHLAIMGRLLLLLLPVLPVTAADHLNGFDAAEPSWQVVIANAADARVRVQRRNRFIRHSGQASENIEIDAFRDNPTIRLEHALPPSAPIEDLELSLQMRSSHTGAVVSLRLVFPKQVDPRSNQTLTALLRGEAYLDPGDWQTLRVDVSNEALRNRITRLRAELQGKSLDLENAFFDRVVVETRLRKGTTEFFFDDLRWTGYASPQRDIVPVNAEVRPQRRRVEMRHDRILIDGRPSIPIFAPHHGEPASRLREIGINVVWVDNYQDRDHILDLQQHGLWAMATPPRGIASAPDASGKVVIKLDGFERENPNPGILFWYLGTRIPGDAREIVDSQVRLVRSEDKLQRPIFADIGGGGLERSYSRVLDGVGLTLHPLQTAYSTLDYRRFLSLKIRQLLPGTFVTTWIQTEIEPEDGVLKSPLPVVEPEQIRLLTWTALSAGVRGIGYWKSTSFDSTFPGARERELIIAIISQEIELLEPWLATRSVIEHRTVPISGISTAGKGRRFDPDRNNVSGVGAIEQRQRAAELRAQREKQASGKPRQESIELSLIHGPNGQLLMPIWHDPDTQFVPGQMASRNLEMVIPGIEDTATIWELSTTGVRTVPSTSSPSGKHIRLDRFDQVAALVVSTDPNWGNILRSRINTIKVRSAALWLELAKARLERVRKVDHELQLLGAGQPDGPQLLDQAAMYIKAAERDYQRNVTMRPDSGQPTRSGFPQSHLDVASIRWNAEAALQTLRILQRAHWDEAIAGRGSPLSSPYTACFQTLPEHWRLVRRIGASPVAGIENRLPSGSFERTDSRQMLDEGWRNIQPELEGIRAAVEITTLQGSKNSILRMLSLKTTEGEPPITLPATPLALETPPVSVEPGQIVHISGRIRIPYPVSSTLEGVTLGENLTGTRLRWTEADQWESFEMIREVNSAADLKLRLTLHGLGEVWFDDLKIVVSDLAPPRRS